MYAVSGISLLFLTFFQSISVGWIYGNDRFYDNIKSMIGYYPSSYFKLCFRFFTPALTMLIFFFYCVQYTPLVLDGYVYPSWANGIGWVFCMVSILCVPGYFIWFVLGTKGSLSSRFQLALKPGVAPIKQKTICAKF